MHVKRFIVANCEATLFERRLPVNLIAYYQVDGCVPQSASAHVNRIVNSALPPFAHREHTFLTRFNRLTRIVWG
jgi:hypothetical protein